METPELPLEIISHILSFLHASDRKEASLVCRIWYEASQDHQFQDLSRQILQRLLTRIQDAVQHPLDLNYLHFICNHKLTFIASLSNQVSIPENVLSALANLNAVVTQKTEEESIPSTEVEVFDSGVGRPKFKINEDKLQELVQMDLSVPCMSKLLGVSRKTVKRALKEYRISLKTTYSNVTDDQLDQLVSDIKECSPNIGSRMVKGKLRALGHRITWTRIWESMRRVDGAGVLSRKAGSAYGCVVRRVYSVPAPMSLVHLDTNHKLIRYGLVIFGAIDGFSRKIMYLGAASDNKASTALCFFLQSVEKYGVPNRVRADQGCENVDIARWMFTVRGCGRGSFMSGKSVHNQSPPPFAQPSAIQLLTFPPSRFTILAIGHSLGMEVGYSTKGLFDIEIESQQAEVNAGIVLPSVACPLNSEGLEEAQLINPSGPSQDHGRDIYISVLNYVLHENTV